MSEKPGARSRARSSPVHQLNRLSCSPWMPSRSCTRDRTKIQFRRALNDAGGPLRVKEARGKAQGPELPCAAAEQAVVQPLNALTLLHRDRA